ncbi:serine/threonine-protein kinase [Kribbella voronezhensis]|uniref:non-specific serine/threonine protein kinase n=1 Tax=Kribbella voronezhensis TaxID=2512212 RepID=A0A4R7T9L8_9ACTN|nr:serine/threonine-protein kinase [Kribbella voronezhensis]TDU88369.1 serine/threonine-protein kinase [Kribbella voronezhensis]
MLVAERYKVGRSLGRGGMGEVFHAVDEQLQRPVALKLMLPTAGDLTSAERFRREARAAARLSDPHLVAVYDFGRHGDQSFLVMELVEGSTVAAELAEHGPLPKDRAIDIVEQSAAGLAAAHELDVVHRDVKPGNLLLTPTGTVKVADFGIAHLPGDGATTLTGTGQIIGSTRYLAPERAQGGRAVKASDVYSLGCVLYELVTGQPPFTGEHPTAILYQHVDTPPTPPSTIRPELAGSFEAVLLQMLAKDPTERPTAADIAGGALRAPLGEVSTAPLVPAAPLVGGAVVDQTAPITPAAVPVVAAPPRRDRRQVLMAGAIAAVAVAAAVTAILLNNNGPNLPATTDVGPKPSVTSGTPGAKSTDEPTSGPTQSGGANQPTQSTSTQPSPSTSPTGSPTSQSPTPSTNTQSPNTPSPSKPSDSPTASTPTKSTPSPTTSESSTPDPTATPPAGTPTPGTQNAGTPNPKS